MKHILCSAALTALMSLPLAAQQTDDQVKDEFQNKLDEENFLLSLSKRHVRGIKRDPDRYLKTLIRQLFQVAPNGVFVETQAETERVHAMARTRAQYASQVLENDLNGNFSIETAEVERLFTILAPEYKSNLAFLMLAADTDNDGALSTAEIAAHVAARIAETPERPTRNLLEFDVDKNGEVDAQELERAIRIIANGPRTE